MKTPAFWQTNNLISTILTPISFIYATITQIRLKLTRPYKSTAHVICIGNITAGGVGKTPLALAIAKKYQKEGKKVFFLTRGYKGKLKNILVDIKNHSIKDTGDEARLLAEVAPTIIAPKRDIGAKMAEALGAEIIIMDDGFQNPSLYKDESILVFNGAYGIGNGKIIPAGPLRESLKTGEKRAKSIIIMGKDETNLCKKLSLPYKYGKLQPQILTLENPNVFAFAGIGNPQKFYKTLKEAGFNVVQTQDFADHYAYSIKDLEELIKTAQKNRLSLVTTKKDFVKIPSSYHKAIHYLDVEAILSD